MWICAWQSWIFHKVSFCSQNWENEQKVDQKQSFLNLFRNLVIDFYWMCSVKKIYICCVPTQIPYLGSFCFWDMEQYIIRQWYILINHISWTNQWNSLAFCMLIQIHIIFEWTSSKICVQSGHRTLKLTLS